MAIKVVISRRVPVAQEGRLKPLLLKLRSLAMVQSGYISGETLMNADDPEDYLVISTWKTLDNWQEWVANSKRQALQDEVDQLLEQDTHYQVYYNA